VPSAAWHKPPPLSHSGYATEFVAVLFYLAVDVTPYAIGVTAALAVGIVVMVAVIIAYFRARKRVEQLRRPPVDIKLRKVRRAKSSATKTSAAADKKNDVPDEVLKILRERRRRAAEDEMIGFEFTYYIIHHHIIISSTAAAVTVM